MSYGQCAVSEHHDSFSAQLSLWTGRLDFLPLSSSRFWFGAPSQPRGIASPIPSESVTERPNGEPRAQEWRRRRAAKTDPAALIEPEVASGRRISAASTRGPGDFLFLGTSLKPTPVPSNAKVAVRCRSTGKQLHFQKPELFPQRACHPASYAVVSNRVSFALSLPRPWTSSRVLSRPKALLKPPPFASYPALAATSSLVSGSG